MGWTWPLDMAIGKATILVLLGAAGMPWRCHCCVATSYDRCCTALLLLGAKQGQDVYLAGQLLPSFLRHTWAVTNHACCRYVSRLPWGVWMPRQSWLLILLLLPLCALQLRHGFGLVCCYSCRSPFSLLLLRRYRASWPVRTTTLYLGASSPFHSLRHTRVHTLSIQSLTLPPPSQMITSSAWL